MNVKWIIETPPGSRGGSRTAQVPVRKTATVPELSEVNSFCYVSCLPPVFVPRCLFAAKQSYTKIVVALCAITSQKLSQSEGNVVDLVFILR
ncbi:hypothetical protein AVEN_29342-1 [Araneus ventricosus]|uniref:Uncharacterized protein n=1 Tax=Araneus ventricosus TaxID=182803 RepID=A0A4Y2IXL2_ARAVE|nr:hypothetical protein AVEN_29342-1 [Araneus ventricosus]